ncbi:MAG: peptidoglycan DD-metalloendopeptidase family protein [Bacteroidota bacterium]|nr:peptidoglycan DD-metalloendopeptidase family protein [Bacteroidota bacterium]MDX5428049.1 peptidoglycan DD-metalloendopeptidase family protein [Bacteroidota bacterium]MDX5447199.1 peptidoglycan DD-metalloendopeptidase family protein [Bacteroidota bacterium]MDX5505886.1 peptidoglycan DD-metalloendopeptidase family protein [Bacteroidota bacterium]
MRFKKGTIRVAAIVLIFGIATTAILFYSLQDRKPIDPLSGQENEDTTSIADKVAYVYGFPMDQYEVERTEIKNGDSFGELLGNRGVSNSTVFSIAENFKDIFDVRRIRAGKPVAFLTPKLQDSISGVSHMIYEASPTEYFVFQLQDSLFVRREEREVSYKVREVTGIIESSLYETLLDQNASPELANRLSEIYAWTIDFFRIQKNDHFKVIFEEKYIEDTIYVGIGRIIAADFNHFGNDLYAFRYQDTTGFYDFYDEKGNTLRKAFLRAPLQFSRISSRYSPKRFHPVLKRWKSHLGTDYAAPTGTPIMTTADGVVSVAGYTSGNGNYVKVRHNSTYETQYLHMSRIAKGMKPGRFVKQGEVIGYVGSTGLATGPHVCYRFWKNGKQVDPLREKLPEAEPIKEAYKEDYLRHMQPLKQRLDEMAIPKTDPEVS